MTTTLSTIPPSFTMAQSEKIPLGIDLTSLLEPGQTPSDPTSTLTQTSVSPEVVTSPANPPTLVGNVATQQIVGSSDFAGGPGVYRLDLTFVADGETTRTASLVINVPY